MTYDTDTLHSTADSPGAPAASVVICGNPDCDITAAQELYSRLLGALEDRQSVVFNMAQVERIDTAIMQMLCAFVRDAQTIGVAVQWQQASPALWQAAELLNVAAHLALPEESRQDGRSTTANVEKQ